MLEIVGTISWYGILSMLAYGGYEYSKIGWEHLSYRRYVSNLNSSIDDSVVTDFMKGDVLFDKLDLIYVGSSSHHEVKAYYSEKHDRLYIIGTAGYKTGYAVSSFVRKTFGDKINYEMVRYNCNKSDEEQILGYEYDAKGLGQLNKGKLTELKRKASYIFNNTNK